MSISNIATLKQIVSTSFAILTSKRQMDSIDVPQAESDAVAKAIINHFQCQMMCEEPEQMDEFESHVNVNLDPTSWKKLTELLNVYFPSFSIAKNVEGGVTDVKTELVEAIKTQLKELHLQDLPLFEEKVKINTTCRFLKHNVLFAVQHIVVPKNSAIFMYIPSPFFLYLHPFIYMYLMYMYYALSTDLSASP